MERNPLKSRNKKSCEKIEFREHLIACVLSQMPCEGFIRSWLSWHGNSILNGQNGPNTKYVEFTYGNRTSAVHGSWSEGNIWIYWYFLLEKYSPLPTSVGYALLFWWLLTWWNAHTHDYCAWSPTRKRINMFIILNWKLLLGEKFIFQFSRYFMFFLSFLSVDFFYLFFIFSTVEAYVQKRRKNIIK